MLKSNLFHPSPQPKSNENMSERPQYPAVYWPHFDWGSNNAFFVGVSEGAPGNAEIGSGGELRQMPIATPAETPAASAVGPAPRMETRKDTPASQSLDGWSDWMIQSGAAPNIDGASKE